MAHVNAIGQCSGFAHAWNSTLPPHSHRMAMLPAINGRTPTKRMKHTWHFSILKLYLCKISVSIATYEFVMCKNKKSLCIKKFCCGCWVLCKLFVWPFRKCKLCEKWPKWLHCCLHAQAKSESSLTFQTENLCATSPLHRISLVESAQPIDTGFSVETSFHYTALAVCTWERKAIIEKS